MRSGQWSLTPRLPIGHNITSFVAVNYRDRAIFTFHSDSVLSLKSAVLDVVGARYTAQSEFNSDVMQWAL